MTDREQTIAALNDVLGILNCSLPRYLKDARPWVQFGEESAQALLEQIVADQNRLIELIGTKIVEWDGYLTACDYPMSYTSYNDVSFDFLLSKMIEYQRRDIRAIAESAERLQHDPRARALAEEALGTAKGHLETLEEMARGPVRQEG